MYAWIFRHLPGPLWVRLVISLLALAGIILLLMMFVFPWVSDQLGLWTESTIGLVTR
ncbi:hypothetical protein [Zhihengliuella flava]|uniref:Uncharacterized protein n=1 Tax=Zhihengliuella flava TaxID=1285193 RepID=A0A931D5B8_9MICC|nr:hypothetical protein [Zhihengliuella flava]MBG6084719.1 hypothetical protein [Zhihengliuella flava]